MKITRIEYPRGMKKSARKLWRQRFNKFAKNLKGNARLEVIVKDCKIKNCKVEISPLKSSISVDIDSEFVFPCIKYASSRYAIVQDYHDYGIEAKVYYKPNKI